MRDNVKLYLCNACLQSCEIHVIDDGVGAYEFAGQDKYDTRLRVVSECCDAGYVEPAAEALL